MRTSRFRGWALGLSAGMLAGLSTMTIVAEEPTEAPKSVATTPEEPNAPLQKAAPAMIPGIGQPGTVLAPILDSDSARMSFQARLTDNMGDPLPGPTVNLSFRLYDEDGFPLGGAIGMNNVSILDGIVDVLVPFSPADFNGAARQIGISVNGGTELAPRLDLGATPYAYRVNRVASEELDDAIDLGTSTGDAGYFQVFGGGSFPSWVVEAAMKSVSLLNDDNTRAVHLFADRLGFGRVSAENRGNINAYLDGNFGDVWAENTVNVGDIENNLVNDTHAQMSSHSYGGWIRTWDQDGNRTTLMGSSNAASDGGFITLYNGANFASLSIDGEDDSGGAEILLRDAANDVTVEMNATDARVSTFDSNGNESTRQSSNTFGGRFESRDETNQLTMISGSSTTAGGFIQMYNGTGALNLIMDADSAGAALMTLDNAASTTTITLDGDTSSGGGSITLRDGTSERITLDADANLIQMFDPAGNETARMGSNGGDGGGFATYANSNGDITIELDGDESDSGVLRLRRANGTVGILARASEGTGSEFNLYDDGGGVQIQLDTDWNGTGNSRIVVDELQISGGSDLSEQFDVSDVNGAVEPGMVVCIDPNNPGKLVVSTAAYDRTVAGIVSGANGIKTGMYMGQKGSEADGQEAIALTGRVYCYVDATNGAIVPGDLLTTSATPGHAMKVEDHAQSQGAIIGKAMTGLDSGKGLVLVLVSLQ
ncbi:MAG: hypothetical protein AB7N71_07825 [Phycisphaerae bacterium]